MTDLKNLGESKIRKMQRKRNSKRIDLEFVTVAILIFLGMTILVANW